ncbi:MAG: glycosyltransferase family 4 protein [Phycisphaeraceae bacterium]
MFCWPGVPGYMSACWRALAARADVELHVVSHQPAGRADRPAPFDFESLAAGLSIELIDYSDLHNAEVLARHVIDQEPDVVVLPGWRNRAALQLASHRQLRHARFVLAMDTPWRGDFRQRVARWRLRPLLERVDRVVVPGERAWQYARRLGVPEQRIRRGLYGIDYDALRASLDQRRARAGGWPRRFLFVGRYAAVKGLDVLLEAYARYRAAHGEREAFELSCCGSGPMQAEVQAAAGVTDHGFVQPNALPDVFAEHGVFVLPSRYDPWPLALVEACAAGLPVICTEACGSAVELVRPHYNGLIVPTEDVDALCGALNRAHAQREALATMGERGCALAAAYGAEAWAQRWAAMIEELAAQR